MARGKSSRSVRHVRERQIRVAEATAGTGNIIMNGGAAHLIKTGERVVIMSFALSDKPIIPKKIVCNEHNEIIS